MMDELKFLSIATTLNQLTNKYINGLVKHYQYVQEYDKIIEANGITKKQLFEEIENRKDRNNTDQAFDWAIKQSVSKKRK